MYYSQHLLITYTYNKGYVSMMKMLHPVLLIMAWTQIYLLLICVLKCMIVWLLSGNFLFCLITMYFLVNVLALNYNLIQGLCIITYPSREGFKIINFWYLNLKSSVGFSPTSEENCELSDKNSHELDIDNPSFYDNSERHDFYQREPGADPTRDARGLPCLDGEWLHDN